MHTGALTLALLLANGLSAPRLEEVSPTTAAAYNSAIRIVSLSPGNRAVIHPIDDPEWKGIVVSLVRQNAETVFQASQWLSHEPLAAGMVGQIFSMAPLRHGQSAASVAWVDAARGIHMDLLTLDADLHLRSYFEVPGGVRDVVAGPGDTLLAVTFDANRYKRTGNAFLLGLFGPRGESLGESLPLGPSVAVQSGIEIAHQARLIELNGRYAFLDAIRGRAILFHLDRSADGKYSFVYDSRFAIDSSPTGVSFVSPRTYAAKIEGDGVLVVRQGYDHGKPATLVLKYRPTVPVTLLKSFRPPRNGTFWEDGLLKGVIQSGAVTMIQADDLADNRRPTN